jgi:hypothetical protein
VIVQCKGCRIEFKVPEEKIPEGVTLSIRCPRCKTPKEIRRTTASTELDQFEQNDALPIQAEFDPTSDYGSEIDVVDEGVRTALLCTTDSKRAEKIAQALHELDFWVFHAPYPSFALRKLHHNRYDLIVFDEDYGSERDSANPVLHHLQLLPMHQRRQFFMCLISAVKPTMDSKSAFMMGVNLILNVRDLEKAKIMLAREMREYRNFYGLFNTELATK